MLIEKIFYPNRWHWVGPPVAESQSRKGWPVGMSLVLEMPEGKRPDCVPEEGPWDLLIVTDDTKVTRMVKLGHGETPDRIVPEAYWLTEWWQPGPPKTGWTKE